DAAVRLEALRLLNEHPSPGRFALLADTVRNDRLPEALRAEAVVGLAERAAENLDLLLSLARGERPALRDEALRALVQTKLTADQQKSITDLAQRQSAVSELAARAVGQPFKKDRPKPDQLAAWLKRLEGPADAAAGRRVFFQPTLAGCFRCHRVNGRGH